MEIISITMKNKHLAKPAQALFSARKNPKTFNAQFFENPNNHMFIALVEKDVAGMIYGYTLEHYDRKEKELFLYSIDVAEKYRRQGIGKALIKAFLQPLESGSCDEAFVLTHASNEAALQLYQKTGAKIIKSDEGNDVMLAWTNLHK